MAIATEADLTSIDLADLDLWTDGPPHPLFARLRAECPVHWSPMSGYENEPGFWSITRAADIAAISRDTATFSSERMSIFLFDDMGVPLDLHRQQMISMDPPKHDRMKALVQRAFTPRRVAHHEERIRRIVNDVLDEALAADGGRCDLVTDVARKVPARVTGDMIGVPTEEAHLLVDWTNRITGFEDENLRPDPGDGMVAMGELADYVMAAVAERRAEPRDDLLSALIAAEVNGEHLTDLELIMFFVLLMIGGNDSTRAVYSGGMRSLMEHRDQLEMLTADPSLIPDAVEEMLRYYPSFMHFRRTATKDTEIHGQPIAAGDKVVLWYVSSSRDETVTEDPDRFDITREAVEHQAFGGGGRHFCLGAGLARLELKVWLEETLRRFPDVEMDGPPVRVRSTWVNQHLSLPVNLTPA